MSSITPSSPPVRASRPAPRRSPPPPRRASPRPPRGLAGPGPTATSPPAARAALAAPTGPRPSGRASPWWPRRPASPGGCPPRRPCGLPPLAQCRRSGGRHCCSWTILLRIVLRPRCATSYARLELVEVEAGGRVTVPRPTGCRSRYGEVGDVGSRLGWFDPGRRRTVGPHRSAWVRARRLGQRHRLRDPCRHSAGRRAPAVARWSAPRTARRRRTSALAHCELTEEPGVARVDATRSASGQQRRGLEEEADRYVDEQVGDWSAGVLSSLSVTHRSSQAGVPAASPARLTRSRRRASGRGRRAGSGA